MKDIEKLPNFDMALSNNWEIDKDVLSDGESLF